MTTRMILFGLAALLVWSALHAWVGWRLVGPARLPAALAVGAWILLALDAVAVPAGMILAFRPEQSAGARVLAWVAYAAMGAFTILWASVAARDLAWWLLRGLDPLLRSVSPTLHLLPSDSEGLRLWLNRSGTAVALAALGVTVAALTGGARAPRTVEERATLPALPAAFEGYRIVQITDLHIGPTLGGPWLAEVVRRVNALSPDLVAITGDLADGQVATLVPAVSALGDLHAPDGVVFVTGNHEYFHDAEGWIAFLRSQGIDVLLNEHRVVERGAERLVLAGVTDIASGRMAPGHTSDPSKALAAAPSGVVRVLLAHQPASFPAAAAAGADLVLSGHTHGGQYFPWTALIGLVEPRPRGWYRIGASALRVSPGTGHWGPPMRLCAPAEISVVVLERGPDG
jgi:hypothetical protein